MDLPPRRRPSALPVSLDPSDLPSPSPAVLQIIRACSRQEISSRQLSRLVNLDTVLTAALLRIVNSAYFGFAGKIKTIPHAVTILGTRSLRNLVLCISVRDALRARTIPGFDRAAYTDDVLRRAVCARCLGTSQGLDGDECFTLGLLQDFGLLALCYLQPEYAQHYAELRRVSPEERYQLETTHFGTTHDRVGQALASAWGLPKEFGSAIGCHHESEEPNSSAEHKLARIAQGADWMTAVFTATAKHATLTDCQRQLKGFFGMDTAACERILQQASKSVEQAAADLGMQLQEHISFEQVMREANLRLAAENMSYQDLVWRLQDTLQERDRLAHELDRELKLAQEIQRSLLPPNGDPSLPLTGLNIPARELSGDFYDYFRLPDGRIYFGLADVAGKGTNAALLMVKTGTLFRSLGRRLAEPEKLLQEINEELCETAIRGMFVTMVAGLYDPQAGLLRLVNAGHPPALLLSPHGELRAIAAAAPPLGILPGHEFPALDLALDGRALYLFSDGVMEGKLEDGSTLGLSGLIRVLSALRALPPAARLQAVASRLKRASTLMDDMTLLVLEDIPGVT
ncbi:MAG: HDOD domain-containing protein [Gammaproteobacteria bacterium]